MRTDPASSWSYNGAALKLDSLASTTATHVFDSSLTMRLFTKRGSEPMNTQKRIATGKRKLLMHTCFIVGRLRLEPLDGTRTYKEKKNDGNFGDDDTASPHRTYIWFGPLVFKRLSKHTCFMLLVVWWSIPSRHLCYKFVRWQRSIGCLMV